MNKDTSHPSNGWDDIKTGDLVYRIKADSFGGVYSYEMGVVLQRQGTAAVLYSYKTNQEALVKLTYLQKVET